MIPAAIDTASMSSATVIRPRPAANASDVTDTPIAVPSPRAMLSSPPAAPPRSGGAALIVAALFAGMNSPMPTPAMASAGTVRSAWLDAIARTPMPIAVIAMPSPAGSRGSSSIPDEPAEGRHDRQSEWQRRQLEPGRCRPEMHLSLEEEGHRDEAAEEHDIREQGRADPGNEGSHPDQRGIDHRPGSTSLPKVGGGSEEAREHRKHGHDPSRRVGLRRQ